MHPSSGVDREYAVRVRGEVDDALIERLKEGILLDDGMARFTDVRYFDGDGQNKWYHVVLMEGKNREVRRLWESQGVSVSRLKRVRYGCIFLPSNVPVGTWVELGQREVNDLADLVGMERKKTRRMVGREKEQFQRAAKRQKVASARQQPPHVPQSLSHCSGAFCFSGLPSAEASLFPLHRYRRPPGHGRGVWPGTGPHRHAEPGFRRYHPGAWWHSRYWW